MALAIMGSDKNIHRVWPDPDYELGLVPIRKVKNMEDGGWDIMYGDEIIEHCADETAANTEMDKIATEMDTREDGSILTVAEIDALS